ncbi:MAG: hypothetical protein ABIJ17_02610 [Patescibacteria group bacterium]
MKKNKIVETVEKNVDNCEKKIEKKYFIDFALEDLKKYNLGMNYLEILFPYTFLSRIVNKTVVPTPGMLKRYADETGHNYQEMIEKLILESIKK